MPTTKVCDSFIMKENAPWECRFCNWGAAWHPRRENPMAVDPVNDPERRSLTQLELPFSSSARPEPKKFTVKDSGRRKEFKSGMQRDIDSDKTQYDLVFDGPMLDRYARHLTLGAKKYQPRNWMKASGKEEYERFRSSAVRHFFLWMHGEEDEDHAAAIFFNVNGAEYVKGRMKDGET